MSIAQSGGDGSADGRPLSVPAITESDGSGDGVEAVHLIVRAVMRECINLFPDLSVDGYIDSFDSRHDIFLGQVREPFCFTLYRLAIRCLSVQYCPI